MDWYNQYVDKEGLKEALKEHKRLESELEVKQ